MRPRTHVVPESLDIPFVIRVVCQEPCEDGDLSAAASFSGKGRSLVMGAKSGK